MADAERTVAVEELIARLAPEQRPATTDLHALLVRRAQEAGLLDVAYTIVDSAIGRLLVAATDAGVVRVAFEREGHDAVLAALSDTISPRILRSSDRTDAVARQLDEYFAGRRHRFEVPLDLRLVSGFRRTVVTRLQDIDYGTTATYAAIAAAAGNAAAVRAAASACSHNPLPLLVPCHRVVRSDGRIGDYLGGAEAKATLLALERESRASSRRR